MGKTVRPQPAARVSGGQRDCSGGRSWSRVDSGVHGVGLWVPSQPPWDLAWPAWESRP